MIELKHVAMFLFKYQSTLQEYREGGRVIITYSAWGVHSQLLCDPYNVKSCSPLLPPVSIAPLWTQSAREQYNLLCRLLPYTNPYGKQRTELHGNVIHTIVENCFKGKQF